VRCDPGRARRSLPALAPRPRPLAGHPPRPAVGVTVRSDRPSRRARGRSPRQHGRLAPWAGRINEIPGSGSRPQGWLDDTTPPRPRTRRAAAGSRPAGSCGLRRRRLWIGDFARAPVRKPSCARETDLIPHSSAPTDPKCGAACFPLRQKRSHPAHIRGRSPEAPAAARQSRNARVGKPLSP
jgi:hypothetical protein